MKTCLDKLAFVLCEHAAGRNMRLGQTGKLNFNSGSRPGGHDWWRLPPSPCPIMTPLNPTELIWG